MKSVFIFFRHLGFAHLPFCSVCMQSLNEALKERHKVVVVTIICISAISAIVNSIIGAVQKLRNADFGHLYNLYFC